MITELRDGVWWLDCTGVNAYLVADEDGLTLVDAGTPLDAARIEAAIESTPHSVDDLVRILITHYDADHVGSAAKLTPEVPVYIGSDDADLLSGERRPALDGFKSLVQLVSRPFLESVPRELVRSVDDGDEIGGFTAHHTPGHTGGHTAYLHEERDAAFLGDLVMERDGELRPSPWYITQDTDENRRSIAALCANAPDFEIAAVGHGTPFLRGGSDRLRRLVAIP